jgi:hypothetical protein
MPRPPLYVGMSFFTPISMEKYAIIGSAMNSCKLFMLLPASQELVPGTKDCNKDNRNIPVFQ